MQTAESELIGKFSLLAKQRKLVFTKVPGEGGRRKEGQKEKPAGEGKEDSFITGLPG